MDVGRAQRIAVGEGDFHLPEGAFRLDRLDGPAHPGEGFLQIVEVAGEHRRVVERVVEIALRHRLRAAPPGLARVGVAQHELGLHTDLGGDAAGGEPFELVHQDSPGCHADGLSVVGQGIGEDQGGAFHPGELVDGVRVGEHAHVAPAGVGGGQGEAVERAHLGVGGQDVGTHVAALGHDVIDEVAGVEPLACQPPLHVGHGQQHGFHRVALHQVAQCLEVGSLGGFMLGEAVGCGVAGAVGHTTSSAICARSPSVPYSGMP